MDNTQKSNRDYSAIGWGLLSLLWGVTILFDFLSFGVGLVGTGLLMIGMNIVRSLNGLPPRGDNTVVGILALVWGGLELGRPILHPLSEFADWDWAIFAILLVALGVTLVARELRRSRKLGVQNMR